MVLGQSARDTCPSCGGAGKHRDLADCLRVERDRYRRALVAVRQMIEPHNPCHDGMREALLDALGEAP